MSHLILITGVEDKNELLSFFKNTFYGQNVCDFWMDPCRYPRAVVLFDKRLEFKDIQQILKAGASDKPLKYVGTAKPTNSVFVRTHKSLQFGVKDKLKYLFMSDRHGGSPVLKVEQLNTEEEDCYKIVFLNWDAVLKTCKQTWNVNNNSQRLTVTPLFESFIEPYKQQLQRLSEEYKRTIQSLSTSISTPAQELSISSSAATWKLTKEPLKTMPPKPPIAVGNYTDAPHTATRDVNREQASLSPSLSGSGSIQSSFPKQEKVYSSLNVQADIKSDQKCARPVLEHPYILMLLYLLKFEKAVEANFSDIKVSIHEGSWEVEIIGPVVLVKMIQKMLTEEDELDQPPYSGKFLTMEAVQQHLKSFIHSEGLCIDFINISGKHALQVQNKRGKGESLHDFISSLVITKECYPLPSDSYHDHIKWNAFLKSFEKNYSCYHIFVEDESVTLASLAHLSDEIDAILNMINNNIIQLKTDESSGLKTRSRFFDHVANPDDNSLEASAAYISDLSSESSSISQNKDAKLKKLSIYFPNPFILWILNALDLNAAVKQASNNLQVDIDEDEQEIIVTGSSRSVKTLKSVVMLEVKRFPFSEEKQEFLTKAKIQQRLKSCLAESGCHIVFNESLEMLVANTSGDEIEFGTFLNKFIHFRQCSDFPEVYHSNKDWESLCQNYQKTYPHHFILTRDDKVFLLSFAPDEKLVNSDTLLEEIRNVIFSLTLNVAQGTKSFAASNQTFGNLKLPQSFTGQELLHTAEMESEVKTDTQQTFGTETETSSCQETLNICIPHPALLCILNNLHLNTAVDKFGAKITIHDDEITIRGPKNIVNELEKLLLAVDEKLPFTDLELKFLTYEKVQQLFKSQLADLECYIVLDDNFELCVSVNGKKAQFTDFLSSFIQCNKCSHLPEKFHSSGIWKLQCQNFEKNNPHHLILTVDDTVYLLSIALMEGQHAVQSFVKKIDELVSVITEEENNVASFSSALSEEVSLPIIKGTLKQKRKTIFCNQFLLQILDILQLNEAVKAIGVNITITEDEITVEGPETYVKGLKKDLLTANSEVPFDGSVEKLLQDQKVQHYLKSSLKKLEAHIVLDDYQNLLVVINSGGETPLKEFLTSFIQFKKCSHLPEKHQTTADWMKLVKQCEQLHPNHRIICLHEEVYLMTITLNLQSEVLDATKIVERINKSIAGWNSPVTNDTFSSDSHKQYENTFVCDHLLVSYVMRFLQDELQALQTASSNCRITFSEKGFIIFSSSPNIKGLLAELEKLTRRIIKEHIPFTYPGLTTYMKSPEFDHILEQCAKHRCLVEIPETYDSHSQNLSISEQHSENSLQLEYKVLLLGTARCPGFNVHLVQGDIDNLRLDSKILLQASKKVELCQTKFANSDHIIIIQLPPWTAANQASCDSHFEQLRISFEQSVSLAIEQSNLDLASIAFSTAHSVGDAEFPFPASVIGKIIVAELYDRFGSGATSYTDTLDVYICDTENDAIFQAFKFFLKLKGIIVGQPDQANWNKVCFPDSDSCTDYNTLSSSKNPLVQIVPYIPKYVGFKTCIFYPVNSSLEDSSCPALKDHSVTEYEFKSSIRDIHRENQDGLLPGQILPVRGFHDGRNAYVYCSPEWGMGCKETIERTLELCFRYSSGCEEMYIIPPGMNVLSKYPDILAQFVFKKLDSLLKGLQSHQRKITLIVHDTSCRKAFEQELQKRYPKHEKEGYIRNFINWLFSTDEEESKKQQKIQKHTKMSDVPTTRVSFLGTRTLDIQNAFKAVDEHLKIMMKKNVVVKQLSDHQRNVFQKVIKDIRNDVLVSIKYEEVSEMKKKKKKGNKKVITKSVLTLAGLNKVYVDSFLDMLCVGRHPQDSVKEKDKEITQVKPRTAQSTNDRQHYTGSSDIADDEPEDTSVQNVYYKWMYQDESGNQFLDFDDLANEIEDAYSKGVEGCQLSSEAFTSVDFTSMTVVKNNVEKGIIRTEIFGTSPPEITMPRKWTLEGQYYVKLDTNSKEYKTLALNLKSCLEQYSLSITEASRVQNKGLYTRFKQKLSLLKCKDSDMMWHVASSRLICQYGFHTRFSAILEAKDLGDGILFFDKPDNCLKTIITSEGEVYLVSANVLVGKPGPAKRGLRRPPSDKETGEPFDSVHGDGACMIFSDAQAYPVHIITLRKKM